MNLQPNYQAGGEDLLFHFRCASSLSLPAPLPSALPCPLKPQLPLLWFCVASTSLSDPAGRTTLTLHSLGFRCRRTCSSRQKLSWIQRQLGSAHDHRPCLGLPPKLASAPYNLEHLAAISRGIRLAIHLTTSRTIKTITIKIT